MLERFFKDLPAELWETQAILLKEKRAVQICLDDVIHLNLIIDKWFDGQS